MFWNGWSAKHWGQMVVMVLGLMVGFAQVLPSNTIASRIGVQVGNVLPAATEIVNSLPDNAKDGGK